MANCQIQALAERRVQHRRVLGIEKCTLEFPCVSDDLPPLHADDAVVPSRLDHLSVEARPPKHFTNDPFLELESVGDDKWDRVRHHSPDTIPQEYSRVTVTPATDNGRRPDSRPDIERGENPDGLILPGHDCTNLVGLKFGDVELGNGSVIELSTGHRRLLEPAIDGVPREPFHTSDRGLAYTLDAECRDLVECRATMLKAVVGRFGPGAEGLPTGLAATTAMASGLGPVESVSDDGVGRSRV